MVSVDCPQTKKHPFCSADVIEDYKDIPQLVDAVSD